MGGRVERAVFRLVEALGFAFAGITSHSWLLLSLAYSHSLAFAAAGISSHSWLLLLYSRTSARLLFSHTAIHA